MSNKHTQGNWKVIERKGIIQIETESFNYEGRDIAIVNPELKQAQANAKLIAAAPELLEALKALLKEARQNSFTANGSMTDTAAEAAAQDVINKATL